MSDIVIKGMEMPKACFRGVHEHCPFYGDCTALRRFCDNHSNVEIVNTIFTSRMEDCPLVKLPPHGDLIDKQTTVKRLMKVVCEGCKFTDDCSWCAMAEYRCIVEKAPTVLEASEE